MKVAYIRVSTEDQVEYSPASQLEKIREYAKRNGYLLPEEYIFTDEGISILDLLIKCNLIPSKGEGKRLIKQGGISLDDEKITDMFHMVSKDAFEKGHVIIKKGKKVFHKVTL